MFIYVCERDWHAKYTHTDVTVCVASSPEDAANWVDSSHPERVRVTQIGVADAGQESRVLATEYENS